MTSRKKFIWLVWLVMSGGLVAWLTWSLVTEKEQTVFLVGETTHGHHQIEMACTACHTDPFGGTEVLQNACVDCHGEELKSVSDSPLTLARYGSTKLVN